ncbi:orotate phosphoribosyltransferase [Flavobacteriaceae bacterium]|nr:orotate phosphoribosyltransferase [Flavobacteriaceae bacterium]MDC1492494.1 orotate phosphoribosyltransferase [Flavobacteriaceae bacterium]
MNVIDNTELKIAEILLKINAIKLSPHDPFKWASGWNSPIYCDNRTILSYPNVRNEIKLELSNLLIKKFGKPDVIAGVATGAIGIGMLVADFLNLPFIYVRPEAKKHGRKNQIEGKINSNQKVVVIEDLISTGKSSINAVKALRNQNIEVTGMVAIFTYGFDVSMDNFKNENIKLETLSNYKTLIDCALNNNYINSSEMEQLKSWNINPSNWKN